MFVNVNVNVKNMSQYYKFVDKGHVWSTWAIFNQQTLN